MTKHSKTSAPEAGRGGSPWHAWEIGVEQVWRGFFGSPDLGPVDFATLERRGTPNDALICPPAFCPRARVDREAPVFAVPSARLRAIVAEAALQQPRTALIHAGAEQDRYLVRTPLMRYPDTVVAQAIPVDGSRSSLALYSRSQIGRSDFGVNRRRLERWMARIGSLVEQEPNRSLP